MKKSNLILCLSSVVLLILISNCEYKPYSQGETLYQFYCANCHMEDGSGLRSLIPPLANTDYLKNHQAELPCIIRNGIKGKITVNGTVYNTEMVGIPSLNEVQINNIINYINHAWGNDFGVSNVKEVGRKLNECSTE